MRVKIHKHMRRHSQTGGDAGQNSLNNTFLHSFLRYRIKFLHTRSTTTFASYLRISIHTFSHNTLLLLVDFLCVLVPIFWIFVFRIRGGRHGMLAMNYHQQDNPWERARAVFSL